jgi:AcrR family transcriptional regulator
VTAPARGRRLDPDARREEILAGALRLFATHPYAAVSTTDLAREAGVARGLINHYFGTKRALYLEVVRQMTTIPAVAVDELPPGSTSRRAGAAVDWFLDAVERQRGLWLSVGTGAAGDIDVDAILAEADEIAADRVLAALAPDAPADPTRARVRSFFGLVRSASREWLVRGTLDRAETRALLVAVLLAVLARDTHADSQV